GAAARAIEGGVASTTKRILAGATDVAIQSTLHPMSYEGALDKYIGQIEVRQDEDGNDILLARTSLYNTLMTEMNNNIDTIDENIALARENGDTKLLAELKANRETLVKGRERIQQPEGA